MKEIQKEQLAKQYDEMIENAKPKEVEVKPKEEDKPKNIEVEPKEVEVKPKEIGIKPIKKKENYKNIVYQEASSSDSDSADKVEAVKAKNNPKIDKIIQKLIKPLINYLRHQLLIIHIVIYYMNHR